ncbi:MAG: hypothetical protein M3155_05865 [Actinomycetota bacterium]|nr:hypothetical protein [Actinomycetota bacterium]
MGKTAASPAGHYVAKLTPAQLRVAGAPPAGVWRLSLDRQRADLSAPGGGGFTLAVRSLSAGQVVFAADQTCEVPAGRAQKSVFRVSSTAGGVRFGAVKAPCPSSAAVLTGAEWRKR